MIPLIPGTANVAPAAIVLVIPILVLLLPRWLASGAQIPASSIAWLPDVCGIITGGAACSSVCRCCYCRRTVLDIFHLSTARSRRCRKISLSADGFDAVRTFFIARMPAWLAFIARLRYLNPMQALGTSPPVGYNLAFCNPSILKFEPLLLVGLFLSLLRPHILFVIIAEMVSEMVFAGKRTPDFLTRGIIAGE